MNLEEEIRNTSKNINKEFETFFSKNYSHLHQEQFITECYSMIRDYILVGGKRLRPFALMLAYKACNGKSTQKVLPIALAIELHHNYSLILDDIMDEDDERRGEPSIHRKLKALFEHRFPVKEYEGELFCKSSSRYAVSFAIMIGNITNIITRKSIQLSRISDKQKNKVLDLLADVDEQIYHGQMMDMYMELKAKVSEAEYLEMIQLKTGVLMGLSFQLGGILAGAKSNTVALLRQMGEAAAVAFQLQDDILDMTGAKGHEVGSDILEGKKTLLMIKTLEKANELQVNIIEAAYGKGKGKAADKVHEAISVINDLGALNYCREIAQNYTNKAKNILSRLEINQSEKQLIEDFIDFMIERKK